MKTIPRSRAPMSRIDVIEDSMVAVLRNKTEWERLEMAFGMWEMAEGILGDVIAAEHPDWTPAQVRQLVARRLAHECP